MLLPIKEERGSTWSLLPGILIVPVFAAIPPGKFKNPGKKEGQGRGQAAMIMAKLLPSLNLYNNFGFEMCQGFNGGRGSAGAVGNVLMEAGASHWELAQGVTSTYSTVGLLGGLILGVFLINRASKKGRRHF